MPDILEWVDTAAEAAAGKQANRVIIVHVGEVASMTEYFVICDGTNARQVKAIVDEVSLSVQSVGGPKPKRIEGRDSLNWVLMDYGDFVVHVFLEETREYYRLEKLWADVAQSELKPLGG